MISSKPERARSLVANFRGSVSRLTLSASLGLAGAAALPATSWAACNVGVFDVTCGTTVTTDTPYLGIPGDNRLYQAGLPLPLVLTIEPGAAISGFGLAANNADVGGVTVVNNGTISVDFGNTPTAGGDAALFIGTSGGLLSYSGTGAITNNGTGDGLEAVQSGIGAIDIVLTGNVSSATGVGIDVRNTVLGTDISVSALDALGSAVGINAQNEGTGSTVITSTGLVRGGTAGIIALNSETAVDLTVNANDVTVVPAGGMLYAGIFADNAGIGTTIIDVTGAIDAGGSVAGIIARNAENAGGLTVTAAGAISGGSQYGIFAANGGTGPTLITATSDVSGGVAGIYAVNGLVDPSIVLAGNPDIDAPGGTSLTVNAGNVSGSDYGAYVFNSGIGNTEVTVSGLAQGDVAGIMAINDTAAIDLTVNANNVMVVPAGGVSLAAIVADNNGSGATLVDVTGTASALDALAGIIARNDVDTTSLTVTTAGTVVGNAYGVIATNGGSGATLVTTTGDVFGGIGGIVAINGLVSIASIEAGNPAPVTDADGGTSLTVDAINAGGAVYAAYAFNTGTGNTSVTVSGLAQGGEFGIIAINDENALAGDLTVNANNVDLGGSGVAGIIANNNGTGSTLVNVTGAVNTPNALSAGILARNGADAGSLTVNATSVSGSERYGIAVANGGTGATLVTATGDVVGGFAGIFAINGLVDFEGFLGGTIFDNPDPGGTSLTIEAADVTGGIVSIAAINSGAGVTSVTSTGLLQAEEFGVYAIAAGGGGTVMNLNDVTATNGDGIAILSAGTGAVDVNVTGTIRAGGLGVQVLGGGDVDVNVVDVIVTEAYSVGIYVFPIGVGTGNTTVTSTGLIQASVSGIMIDSGGGDVVVNANNITVTSPDIGGGGIDVHNYGFGSTTVTATGSIDGGDVGIGVYNDIDATSLTINAASASGSLYGILVWNDGVGPTSITTTGTILGGHAGISVDTLSGTPTTIVNNGTLANRDGLSTSLAVEAFGGMMDFTNNGTLLGTVYFDGFDATLTNAGIWYVPGGTNEFGGGTNALVNEAGGIIVAGTADGLTATTVFNDITFTNRGTFTMAGGAAGDRATINGNASFEAGSTYAVDLGAGGAADLLTVNGTVALLAGSTLAAELQGGLIDGARYTVLTATGGVSGTFGALDAPATAFLSVDDFYDANNVYLDVTQFRSFASVGLTPNQIATANGLESLPTSNPLFSAILNLPTDAQARAAFDSLSGEIGASAKGVLLNDSQFLRSAVFDRLTSAGSSTSAGGIAVAPLGYAAPAKSQKTGSVPYPVKAQPVVVAEPESAFWAQAFGSWGDTNGNGNAAGLDRNTGGFFIGADTLVGDAWRLGVLGGYSQTSFDVDARASSGDSDNFHLGAYAGTNWGAVNFRAGASYTWNDISTSRSVFIPTAQLLQADYDAGTAQVFGELGYGLTFGAVDFEPFVGLAYVNLSTDGYTETGGIAALNSSSDSTDATYSTLGLRASTSFALGSFDATAKGLLGWRHAFGDITPTSAYQFASGSSPFTVGGVPIAEDAALVEVGLDVQLMPLATFGVAYGGQFGDGATDQSLTAKLNWKF